MLCWPEAVSSRPHFCETEVTSVFLKPLLFCFFVHLQLRRILNDTLYFLKTITMEFLFLCGGSYSVRPIHTFTMEILWLSSSSPPLLFLSVFPEWAFSHCGKDSLSDWVGGLVSVVWGTFLAEGVLLLPRSWQTFSVLQIANWVWEDCEDWLS